ncbi:MAG: hypothetical protein HC855_04700 [Rhizobiales bacterium]|nr:hypothetical protein [Hyphomicrobiales bacterium]
MMMAITPSLNASNLDLPICPRNGIKRLAELTAFAARAQDPRQPRNALDRWWLPYDDESHLKRFVNCGAAMLGIG